MNDQELTELAAKAYGLEGYTWYENPFDRGMMRRNFEPDGFEIQSQLFNPLDFNNDAFLLMVKLHLHIGIEEETTSAWHKDQFGNFKTELHQQDAYAATRRVIVLAAAEIGKKME
jgi:hypothetical protein